MLWAVFRISHSFGVKSTVIFWGTPFFSPMDYFFPVSMKKEKMKNPDGLGVVQRVAIGPSLSWSLCTWSPKPRMGDHEPNTFSLNLDNNLLGKGVFSKEAMRAHQSSFCSPRFSSGDEQDPEGSQTIAEPGNAKTSSVVSFFYHVCTFCPRSLRQPAHLTLQNLLLLMSC